jgi:hypothetical protein
MAGAASATVQGPTRNLIQSSRNARIVRAPEYARAAVERVFDSSAAIPRLFKNSSSETLSYPKPAFPSRWRAPGSIGEGRPGVSVRAIWRARASAVAEPESSLGGPWHGDLAPVSQASAPLPRSFGPTSGWPTNRTESGRTVSSHPRQACCQPLQVRTVLSSGSAGHMPVARIRSFRSTSFRGDLVLRVRRLRCRRALVSRGTGYQPRRLHREYRV